MLRAAGHHFPVQQNPQNRLQDLFFHCRWSIAHVFLPLVQGRRLAGLQVYIYGCSLLCTSFQLRPRTQKLQGSWYRKETAPLWPAEWTGTCFMEIVLTFSVQSRCIPFIVELFVVLFQWLFLFHTILLFNWIVSSCPHVFCTKMIPKAHYYKRHLYLHPNV